MKTSEIQRLYKSHKTVRAFKISSVRKQCDGSAVIFSDSVAHIAGEDPGVEVSKEYIDKHNPYPGGYWVEYEDGYQSFSPAGAFEQGYSEIFADRVRRRITTHEFEELGPTMSIEVLDDPGPGGASHRYRIFWGEGEVEIPFQCGPRKEANLNGLLEPALLAIIIDRLEAFQAGPYPSSQGMVALGHLRAALGEMRDRVLDRVRRGVMGTSAK